MREIMLQIEIWYWDTPEDANAYTHKHIQHYTRILIQPVNPNNAQKFYEVESSIKYMYAFGGWINAAI